MANFRPAFERMIKNEGGYVLHQVPGDRGGMTYAGIARNAWPQWEGWKIIDRGGTPDAEMVRRFYLAWFWTPIRGDMIDAQRIAESIFDFAVNAGVKTAVVLAQTVAGATPDGSLGPKTLEAINKISADRFVMAYALAKIARYAAIVRNDRSQGKFLLGWINRTLSDLKEEA